MSAYVAALCIRLYQRFISPYKGYRCAHRALHGGPSCSEFARLYALDHGLWAMLAALRIRFRECRLAKETMMFARKGRRDRRSRLTGSACDAVTSCTDTGPCGSSKDIDASGACDALPDGCDCWPG